MGARLPCRVPASVEQRVRLARATTLDAETVQILRFDDHKLVLRALAKNSVCRGEVLLSFLNSDTWAVKHYAAQNPNIPSDLLRQWAVSDAWDDRRMAASNPMTPPALLDRLAQDDVDVVQAHVAKNPSAPHSALQRLATHTDIVIRQAVASRADAPSDLLYSLSHDRWPEVQAAADKSIQIAAVRRGDVPSPLAS